MNAPTTINSIFAFLGLAAIVLSAHYLAQIRDITREIRDTQKRLADRLGCTSSRR